MVKWEGWLATSPWDPRLGDHIGATSEAIRELLTDVEH